MLFGPHMSYELIFSFLVLVSHLEWFTDKHGSLIDTLLLPVSFSHFPLLLAKFLHFVPST